MLLLPAIFSHSNLGKRHYARTERFMAILSMQMGLQGGFRGRSSSPCPGMNCLLTDQLSAACLVLM